MTRLRLGSAQAAPRGAWAGARWAAFASMLAVAALMLAACDATNDRRFGTNTYPINFFSEMHHSVAWGSQEPPRLNSPPTAVPYRGGPFVPGHVADWDFTLEEARALENPLDPSPEALELAATIYNINCAQCHGPDGQAQTFIAAYWVDVGAPPPAVLTSPEVQDLPDGEIYYVLTHGRGAMPPFGNLLTPEQRWALVLHIREEFGGQ